MPPGFLFPHHDEIPFGEDQIQITEVWVPLGLTPKEKSDRGFGDSAVIGRLRQGLSAKQAQAEMSTIMQHLDALHAPGDRGWIALVKPFVDTVVGEVRPQLWLLFGAVDLVLLIACANVANLLMARAAGRAHQTGVRAALGATRFRLIRQAVAESMLLATAGGTLGVILACNGIRILLKLQPGDIPRMEETTIDSHVLLFVLGVSLLTGFVFGLLPALSSTRVDIVALLKTGGNKGTAGTSLRMRRGLIAAEVGLSVVLLIGAGLLIRSYMALGREDPGFAQSTLTTRIWFPDRARLRDLLAEISALPGVDAAGYVSNLPLSHTGSVGFIEVEGYPNVNDQAIDTRRVTPGYFDAMRIPLLRGRQLGDRGEEALVNRAFEKQFFGGRSAVGKRLRGVSTDGSREEWRSIVGVVGDVKDSKIEKPQRPAIYRSIWRSDARDAFLAVRSSTVTASVIRTTIARIDPAITVADFQTMNQIVSAAGARRKFQTFLLCAFAAIALLLTLVGVYGLVAYSVKQRTSEIGIRMALGATRLSLLKMVMVEGAFLSMAGLVPGLLAAMAFRKVIAGWLYRVEPADPVTFIGAPVLIFFASLGACLIPAWKATVANPSAALRDE
jgi:predicted permease